MWGQCQIPTLVVFHTWVDRHLHVGNSLQSQHFQCRKVFFIEPKKYRKVDKRKSNFVTLRGICIKITFPQKSFCLQRLKLRRRNPNRNPPKILKFRFTFAFTFSTPRLRLIKSKWNMKKCESSKKATSRISLSSSSLILCIHCFFFHLKKGCRQVGHF